MAQESGITRRDFVRGTGGLVVGFSLWSGRLAPEMFAAVAQVTQGTDAGRLDSWLHIDSAGIVHMFVGKADIGMGVETAFMQIVAEELDVPVGRVNMTLGDTSRTPDQGGTGASTGVRQGGRALRSAAATARALLVERASGRLGAPVDQLQVRDGIVSLKSDASKSVSYTDLVASGELNDAMKVTGQGFGRMAEGKGKPKDPSQYTVVGTSVPRVDIPKKVLGTYPYVVNVRVPGMLHGRVVRPSGVGAKFVSLDDSAAKKIQGYVQTVVKGDFVGVVAETEWGAISATKAIKVTWSAPVQAFPEQKDLYQHMRTVKATASRDFVNKGDVAAALTAAAKKVEGSYDVAFQSHATMGPGCAVADVRGNGVTTVWSGAQKMHAMHQAVADMLNVPTDRVRVVWTADAGSYGRSGFEDVTIDAVILSQAVGKPVRVQWMRSDLTAWGPKGPAIVADMAAAIDAKGQVTGFQYHSRAFSGEEIWLQPYHAGSTIGGQLIGIPNDTAGIEYADWGGTAPPYVFDNLKTSGDVIPALYETGSPLRTTHLRDPNGPANTFVVDCFIDEVAAAAGVDPIEFRIAHIDDPRAHAVLRAAAEKANWDKRPSPRQNIGAGDVVTGRGASLTMRAGTYVGLIAEVQVNRKTGDVKVTRFVCAHDCGLIVNPDSLTACVEANLVQSMSRSLKEEVTFDRSAVTSVDWLTYPVARAADIPQKIEVVLLNHPEAGAAGAGEASSRPTPAAIGNAIFDATGVRVRHMPMTPARVKAALAQA